jgi:solute carrier family 25 aspartate/glutamate transporter 12/13
MKLHFGKERKRTVAYNEFTQVLHDFHEEHAIQAFKRFDKGDAGVITPMDFSEIMQNVKSHLLSDHVRQNLVAVSSATQTGHQVTFPYFMAFNTLLNNMELIKRIYLNFTKGNPSAEVTKEEFLYAAQQMSQITPMEIDILFSLGDLLHNNGRITLLDIERIAPYRPVRYLAKPFAEVKAVNSPEDRGVGIQVRDK